MIAALILALGFLTPSLASPQSSEASKDMERLQFLEGEWSGSGWHDHGDAGINHFYQTISVGSKLDGKVLILEQKAIMTSDDPRVLHHSVVVYRFDRETARGGTERWEISLTLDGTLLYRAINLESGVEFFRLVLERQENS